jgi:hypothetical protein
MARTKEEQRAYDRERKRKQREKLWKRPYDETMNITSKQITVSASARYSLTDMAKRMDCTISEILSALDHLDKVIGDAWREDRHLTCTEELFRKAMELDREASERFREGERKEREARALLKTYKKEEL